MSFLAKKVQKYLVVLPKKRNFVAVMVISHDIFTKNLKSSVWRKKKNKECEGRNEQLSSTIYQRCFSLGRESVDFLHCCLV